MLFHPAFAPLHARLTGMEPEMAQVGAHRLAALYPVAVASYAPFLIDFYTTNSHLSASDIRESGSGVSMLRVAASMLAGYDTDTFFKTHPRCTDSYVQREVGPTVLTLNALLYPQKANIALRRQLATLMKMQYLLSHWNDAAFATLSSPVREGFLAKVDELSAFFGVRPAPAPDEAQTATCAREPQLIS